MIDLHTHSNYSPCGKQTINDIILAAKKHNIKILSVTDHDTTNGVAEAIKLGNKHNIVVVPGIEISTTTKSDTPYFQDGSKIHILGYNIDYQNVLFSQLPSKNKKSNNWLSPKEAVELINKVGGIPVIAHPFRKTEIDSYDENQEFKLISYLKQFGLQGVEVFHYSNTQNAKIQKLLTFCKQEKLVATLGSDRHRTHSEHYGQYFSKLIEPFVFEFDETNIVELLRIAKWTK